MPVIKHNHAKTVTKGAIVLDFTDLSRQGREILDQARAEAQHILDEAQQEADRRIAAADAQGHAQGLERGLQEGREKGTAEAKQQVVTEYREQLATISAAWEQALAEFDQRRETLLLEAREDVLHFAFEMGRVITNRTVQQDPMIIKEQLREAISLLNQPTRLTLVIHPADRSIVEDVLPGVLAQLNTTAHAELLEDGSIHRGGCIARTAGGEVDATLQTQLERIAQTLLPARDAHAEAESPGGDRARFLSSDADDTAPERSEPSA